MRIFHQEQGQATIEYVLVLGVVAGLAVIMISGFSVIIPQIVELMCPAVDTATTGVSCVGP